MNDAETPKTPREELEELIKSSGLFKRTPEDWDLIRGFTDEITKIALDSSDAVEFHDRVKRIDPSIGWTFKPDEMPRKYVVACELLQERARNKMEKEDVDPDVRIERNKFFASLKERLGRKSK
jgi:hypothetical protein